MPSRYDLLVDSLETKWDGLAFEYFRDPNVAGEIEKVEAELRNICPTSSCLPENYN